MTTLTQAAALLAQPSRIRILTHQSPDGDTLGSAAALCLGLRLLGKQAQFVCSDEIPAKYDFMLGALPAQTFEPDCTVAVDIADSRLLGDRLLGFAADTALCIDHHGSNTGWAAKTYLDATAAATCEIIVQLLDILGVTIDKTIANCLYTGLSTDTGCFRYSNTTPRTLRLAAALMEAGADAADINLRMFEIKTPARLELEHRALDGLTYAFGGGCAVMVLSRAMVEACGATEGDLEGLAPIPRNIEGVRLGLTLRERAPGDFKISARSDSSINASAFCRQFGGGGHPRAAGCRLSGSADEVTAQLLRAAAPLFPGIPEAGVPEGSVGR